MFLELLISLSAYDKTISNYNLNLFRRIIIGGVIAPHGITDIFDKNLGEFVVYHIYMLVSIILDYFLWFKLKLFLLTFSSLYHMRHDIGKLWSRVLHILTITILPTNFGLDIFLLYMTLIHTPLHYYNHIRTKEQAIVVIIFSFICLMASINEDIFIKLAKKLPVNGIIWGHILEDEFH